jgi:hypothetical protein
VTTGSPTLELRYALAQFADGSGDLEAGHERRLGQLGPPGEITAAEEHIDQSHRGMGGVDADLTGAGPGVGQLGFGENVRPAEFVDDDRAHGSLRLCRSV